MTPRQDSAPRRTRTRRRSGAWVLALLALLAQLAGLQFAAAHQAGMLALGGPGAQVCSAAGNAAAASRVAWPASPEDDTSGGLKQPCTTCAAVAIAPPPAAIVPTLQRGSTALAVDRDTAAQRVAERALPPARAPPALG